MLYSGKLLLVSSDWEAFGLNIVEAGRHGIPTISRSVEGIPEVINDGISGYLVSDELEFRSILTKLIQSPLELEELSSSTFDYFKKRFLPLDQISSYYKIYIDLLCKKNRKF